MVTALISFCRLFAANATPGNSLSLTYSAVDLRFAEIVKYPALFVNEMRGAMAVDCASDKQGIIKIIANN
ncbi:MAG: hypothetical protein ABIN13_00205, partial [Mucilaginibacter sp.]